MKKWKLAVIWRVFGILFFTLEISAKDEWRSFPSYVSEMLFFLYVLQNGVIYLICQLRHKHVCWFKDDIVRLGKVLQIVPNSIGCKQWQKINCFHLLSERLTTTGSSSKKIASSTALLKARSHHKSDIFQVNSTWFIVQQVSRDQQKKILSSLSIHKDKKTLHQ